jgi:hypothetical protein
MSEDPKGFAAGDYNLFRYCHNDPEDLTDPMGTEITLPPGPNHASPLIEESARQMWFSSSYGAIAYGVAAYAAASTGQLHSSVTLSYTCQPFRNGLISIIVITNQFAFSGEAGLPVHVNMAKQNYA